MERNDWMELIKERVNIGETVCGGKTQVMSDGDIFVPDIKPDMLKILQVDAASYITETSVTDGRLNISGKIRITVLYVPDCENEKIRSMNASFDFSQRVENGAIEAGMSSSAVSNVDRLEFSALNSRKLRIKAIVGVDYEVVNISETEIVSGTEDEDVEVMTKTLRITEIRDMCRRDFSLSEKTEIPSGQGSINEILKTDIKIADTEYKNVTGKIIVKGAVCICVLYTDDDCNIEFTETEIPFTEVLECDSADENAVCDMDYWVGEVSSTVSEDNDGDRRIIETTADIGVNIRVMSETETEILNDCYVPYYKTQTQNHILGFSEVTERPFLQMTLREIVEFSDDVPEAAGVYNVIARPVISKAELQNGRLVCEGSVETYILYLSDSEENPIYSMKKSIPFSGSAECNASGEPRVKAEVKHTGYSLNAAGELELRCIISINAEIYERHEEEVIDSVTVSDGERKHGIVIYFVREGDTLWETAKRYGVPEQEIIRLNNLEDDSLSGGMRLFIPVN